MSNWWWTLLSDVGKWCSVWGGSKSAASSAACRVKTLSQPGGKGFHLEDHQHVGVSILNDLWILWDLMTILVYCICIRHIGKVVVEVVKVEARSHVEAINIVEMVYFKILVFHPGSIAGICREGNQTLGWQQSGVYNHATHRSVFQLVANHIIEFAGLANSCTLHRRSLPANWLFVLTSWWGLELKDLGLWDCLRLGGAKRPPLLLFGCDKVSKGSYIFLLLRELPWHLWPWHPSTILLHGGPVRKSAAVAKWLEHILNIFSQRLLDLGQW